MSEALYHNYAAIRAIDKARELLAQHGGARLETEHLFFGVVDVLGPKTLEILGLEEADLEGLLAALIEESAGRAAIETRRGTDRPKESGRFQFIVSRARSLAIVREDDDVIRADFLLKAIVDFSDGPSATLSKRYLTRKLEPGDNRPELNRDVFEHLRQSVVGQKAAVTRFFDAFKTCWERPVTKDRPIGVFWVVGPPGAGKETLAATLQREVFRDDEGLVRFNMASITTGEGVERLFGSPPYTRAGIKSGVLADAVRENPDCVVLLQNIDQAHPAARDVLFKMFKEGHLIDGSGRVVDFSRTVVIMTSETSHGAGNRLNLNRRPGSDLFLGLTDIRIGVSPNYQQEQEFASSFGIHDHVDEIVGFQPLERNRRLRGLKQAFDESFPGLEERNISFVLTHVAREWFFERVPHGDGEVRGFKRLIEEHVSPEIYAEFGEPKVSDETAIFVEVEGETIVPKSEPLTLLAETLEDAIIGLPFQWLMDDRDIYVDITPDGAEWLGERIHEFSRQRQFDGLPSGDEEPTILRVFGPSKLYAARAVLNRFVLSPLMGWFLKRLVPDHHSVRFHPEGGELTMVVSEGPIVMKLTDSGLQEWWLRRDIPETKGIPLRSLIDEGRLDPRLVMDPNDHVPADLWAYLEKWERFLPEPVTQWALARSSELGLVWPWRIGWYWETFPLGPEEGASEDESDADDADADSNSEEDLTQSPRPAANDTPDNYYLIEPDEDDAEDAS